MQNPLFCIPFAVSLYSQLQTANSEEDVKDAYIKALADKLRPQVIGLGCLR